MLLAFFLFVPLAAAAPTEPGTTPTVQETGKTGKFRPEQEESGSPVIGTSYRELTYKIAVEYGVSGSVMAAVVECESEWNPRAIGDHGNSYGLAQIYMPVWGKEVSIAEAQDPEFALRFMAKKMAAGQGNLWTCYRKMQKPPSSSGGTAL